MRRHVTPFRLFVASVVAAVVPVVVAAFRAIDRGWVPVGDNALQTIRARDVFSSKPPLIGTWSSASAAAGTDVNHPGPLLDDFLALPVRIVGSGAGIAVGIALINALAIVGIAVFAYRRGGPVIGTAAAAGASMLAWSLGSELLLDPWNPYGVVLPFLCFLVLVWSVTCADLVALPIAAGVGSLVLQTHLSYVVLVPVLGIWAVVGLVLELRRRHQDDAAAWPALRRRVQGFGVVAGVVFVACWAQPLWEQFTGDGKGNLSRLADSTRDPADAIGFGLGTRVVASVVSLPPFWLRPTFHDAGFAARAPGGWRPNSIALAIVSLVALGAVLAWAAWDARRRADRMNLRLVTTAVVALAVALLTAGRAPVSAFGTTAHQFRWLWPLSVFIALLVFTTIVRRYPTPAFAPVLAGALVAVVFAGWNLPTSDQGISAPPESIPVARDLEGQLRDVDFDGTVLVEGRTRFADPYSPAVMAALQRAGVDFVVGPGLIPPRQLNSTHDFTGDNADSVLTIVIGEEEDGPSGSRRIAFRRGETPNETVALYLGRA
ncbi:MAG: hypothetical protein ACT4PI_05680 [Actinomycetota bacterium]